MLETVAVLLIILWLLGLLTSYTVVVSFTCCWSLLWLPFSSG
jgi:hypothetical protein